MRRRSLVAVAAGGLILAGTTGLGSIPGGAATTPGFGSNWPVYHRDALGRGVDPTGTVLSPATHAWTSPTLDGQVYGEPLVQAGRVVVATENNTVYALAARTGRVLWTTHIAAPVNSSSLPCGDISPTVGITSTPVIDASRSEIFVVDDQSTSTGGASHHLVGLDLGTGAIRLNTSVDPVGSLPLDELQRPGLALDAGKVLIGFGGNAGDCGTYHGWLVGEPEGGGAMQTFEVAKNTGDLKGAIWMGGAAPIVGGNGNIWVATGNSTLSSGTYDNSDGVLELSSNLVLRQAFAPSNWGAQNAADQDLGSASPSLMSDGLILEAGKSQTAYLLSRSSLGGVGGQLAEQSPYCSANVDGGSAISGEVVYTPCQAGVVKTRATPASSGHPPTISSVWRTSTGAGGPPILAGGLVWTIGGGKLYGLDPATGNAKQTFSLGSVANHFPTPTVADGLLLAPVTNTVEAFDGPNGLPPPPG